MQFTAAWLHSIIMWECTDVRALIWGIQKQMLFLHLYVEIQTQIRLQMQMPIQIQLQNTNGKMLYALKWQLKTAKVMSKLIKSDRAWWLCRRCSFEIAARCSFEIATLQQCSNVHYAASADITLRM